MFINHYSIWEVHVSLEMVFSVYLFKVQGIKG